MSKAHRWKTLEEKIAREKIVVDKTKKKEQMPLRMPVTKVLTRS
jgi:hypothetical protein